MAGYKRMGVCAALVLAIALASGCSALIENKTNKMAPHEPYAVSAAALEKHNQLTIMDWHCDSLLWNRDLTKRSRRGHVDIPRLQEGNVAVQMFTVVTKSPSGQNYEANTAESDNITKLAIIQGWPSKTYSSLLERALHQAQKLHGFEAKAPESMRPVLNRTDLEKGLAERVQAKAEGRPAPVLCLLGLEGCHALEGKLENVQTLYDAGFRMIGLHHFFDNELGGSLHGVSNGGLTDFGRDVVRKLDDMGVIIDVAHSSTQVVEDVLDIAKRPVVISHTGVYGACPIKRNFPDHIMKRIAERGGLISIGYWDAVCDISPQGVVKSIRYAIDLAGEDHVALGSDFDGATKTAFDASELAALTQAMMDAGFTDSEITKVMGGNAVRFLQAQLPE